MVFSKSIYFTKLIETEILTINKKLIETNIFQLCSTFIYPFKSYTILLKCEDGIT